MSPAAVTTLLQRLSERDVTILESLRTYRLLTTILIRRLHFAEGHATIPAASGATMRVLTRLEALRLVVRLERRIGGVRAGSSGIVWQLGGTGERLLRARHGDPHRRRYQPPSPMFTAHTLAVAELAVQLRELDRQRSLELVKLDAESTCWRSFIGAHGTREWLKPDLHVIAASGDYEDHWFLEADLASEHPPVVVRKAKVYQRYAATGAHQTRHGLFPVVAWVVPDPARQRALQAALSADRTIQRALFHVVTADRFADMIRNGPGEAREAPHGTAAITTHMPKGGTA
jgi:hypothetical protein